MEMKVIFSQRLCALREARGKEYTRQKVANDLNISRASLEYYEKGQRLPDIEIAAKIADYYNVSVDYLLGRSNSQSNDKELTEVAECLGISDSAALAIQQFSGKISAEEAQKWMDENNYNDELVNGFNSSSADICNWIINNLLWNVRYTVGALLAQMYRMNKYPLASVNLTRYEDVTLDFSDFAHLLINKCADNFKYKIDDLLKKCSKTGDIKYHSLYGADWLRKEFVSSIEEYKKRLEWFDDIFPF